MHNNQKPGLTPKSAPKKTFRVTRLGFTLIELLIVIAIIGVLAALIVPAVGGAQRRARIAQVRTEISALDSAIASFKAEFGIEPPGSIRIFGTQAGWDGPGATTDDEAIRVASRAYIRQIWPQFDFTTAGGLAAIATPFVELNGAECLVFFLGGVQLDDGVNRSVIGFSKNPAQPFSGSGTNRVKPFFDFLPSRLSKLDGDIAFEYLDPIPNQKSPYLYFSSNDGRGYSNRTIGGTLFNTDCCTDAYQNASAVASSTWANGNWIPNCYFSDGSFATPYMAKKWQIISPGFGGTSAASPTDAYGIGGQFDPKNLGTLKNNGDQDNITNFHQGTLGN